MLLAGVAEDELAGVEQGLAGLPFVGVGGIRFGEAADAGLGDAVLEAEVLVPREVGSGFAVLLEEQREPVVAEQLDVAQGGGVEV